MLKSFRYTAIRRLALLGAALLTIGACDDDDDDPTGPGATAQLRVMHASPNAPNVDVLVDNETVLTNVAYRAVSPFDDVAAGSRRIRVRATGTTTAVIDENVDFVAGNSYTVLAAGLLTTIEPVVALDNLEAPPSGQMKLRVIHAAPTAGSVDVYVTAPGTSLVQSTPVLSNVAFRAISAYLTVDPGTYQIRVTAAGTTSLVIDTPLTVAAGQIRTIVATEAVGSGTPLAAVVLVDLN